MAMNNQPIIIRNHRLKHIPQLLVDPTLFVQRLAGNCSILNCNGKCCWGGVLVDIEEKENILLHASVIQNNMELWQNHNPSQWFDGMIENDTDFPSGQCDGTAVYEHGCVFLDSKGLCVLQKTEINVGLEKFSLKPFFCVAFPLTIDNHVLTTYEPEFTGRVECCSVIPDGTLTLLDCFRQEFEFMLGEEGLKEIQKMFVQEKSRVFVEKDTL